MATVFSTDHAGKYHSTFDIGSLRISTVYQASDHVMPESGEIKYAIQPHIWRATGQVRAGSYETPDRTSLHQTDPTPFRHAHSTIAECPWIYSSEG